MQHTTRALYGLSPEDVEDVARRTTHPLGNIRKAAVDRIETVADWRPDFAFTHVFHYALEALECMFTFDDFRAFCMNDPQARAMLGDPAREITRTAAAEGTAPAAARDAVRWRVGLAYYSFLRETYTLAVLRAEGLDVRAHPLADALFRVDAWIDRTVISLYIRNAKYRDGGAGRKSPVRSILARADPAFDFADLELDVQHVFGEVHMPVDQRIRDLGWIVFREGHAEH
jgi:hypothetical protein